MSIWAERLAPAGSKEASRLAVVHVIASDNDRAIADVARTVAHEMARDGVDVVLVAFNAGARTPRPARDGDVPVVRLDGTGRRILPRVPQLLGALRRLRPDVVFCHGEGAARATILAASMLRPRPAVVTVIHNHYSSYAWNHRRLRRRLDASLLRHAHAITGVSPGVSDDLADHFPHTAARVSTLPTPLTRADDLADLLSEPVEHPWFDGRPLLVSVGHLHARKDQETLVRALAKLRHRHPQRNIGLLLIGANDGVYGHHIRALVHELGLDDHVDFLGALGNPLPYVARATVLVSTSRNEGMGIAILEAMAVGTAVVATDAPAGPSWLLEDGQHGLLTPVGDVSAITDAISTLLEDAALRSQLIFSARQRARGFTPRDVADHYTRLALSLRGSAPTRSATGGHGPDRAAPEAPAQLGRHPRSAAGEPAPTR